MSNVVNLRIHKRNKESYTD